MALLPCLWRTELLEYLDTFQRAVMVMEDRDERRRGERKRKCRARVCVW